MGGARQPRALSPRAWSSLDLLDQAPVSSEGGHWCYKIHCNASTSNVLQPEPSLIQNLCWLRCHECLSAEVSLLLECSMEFRCHHQEDYGMHRVCLFHVGIRRGCWVCRNHKFELVLCFASSLKADISLLLECSMEFRRHHHEEYGMQLVCLFHGGIRRCCWICRQASIRIDVDSASMYNDTREKK